MGRMFRCRGFRFVIYGRRGLGVSGSRSHGGGGGGWSEVKCAWEGGRARGRARRNGGAVERKGSGEAEGNHGFMNE